MSLKEQVTALVATFKGGGTVDVVIEAATNAGVPVKDAARDWYMSTDKSLSKNKASLLARDACTIWWQSKGKAQAAARTSDLSETHYLSVERETASGAIHQKWIPQPKVVVKNQGDVARLAIMVQKKDSIIEQLMAEVKSLRETVKAGTITVSEPAEIKPPAVEEKPAS